MLVQVHIRGMQSASEIRSLVQDQIDHVLSKFEEHVGTVTVNVEDINGPRGGIDKHCRCVVNFKRRSPLIIEDQDDSVRRLVDRVCQRVSQNTAKRLARKR